MSTVTDRNQPEVVLALLEYAVVGLPDLLWGGPKWEPGIGKGSLGKYGMCAILVAFLGGLC